VDIMETTNRQSPLRVEGDMDPLFLRAVRGEAVETTPLWIMRQAGRYLPEYRRLREEADFLTLCRTPDLATEASLQPIRRFGLDAAILFSDIMIPVEAMGVDVRFNPGPVIESPIRDESAVRNLRRPDPARALGFVLKTVRNLRRELPGPVALIGFAGGPFTMAAYMVEGGASKEFSVLKGLMFKEPVVFHALMEKLGLVVSDYLKAQIEAGAQAVQLFDTWAGMLSPRDYEEFVLPHVTAVVERTRTPGVPFILYGNGTGGLLERLERTGADVIGLDWRIEIGEARRRLGPGRAIQGNLDPSTLFAPPEIIRARSREILEQAGTDAPHVFNLGHGISRWTPLEAVESLVRAVHESGRELRAPAA